jgi:pimeloyl-ACP methyl ester carboxylesterase
MCQLIVTTFVAAILAAQASGAKLAVAGGEIAYDVAGDGAPVVLLHGGFMDRRAWDPQMPALTKGFRVIRYDIRPFGESSKPEQPYSTSDDLLQLLDHLKINRAFLIGHSFGGQVAIDFALTHQNRVAGLVLVGAAPSGTVPTADETKAIGAIFAASKQGEEAVLKAWLNHPLWSVSRNRPDVMSALEASTRRSMGVFKMTAAPYKPIDPPAINRLREIKVPTLVVVGDKDMASLQKAAEMMANTIPGATLRVIPGADHALPIGWSNQLNDAAMEFLKRHNKQ